MKKVLIVCPYPHGSAPSQRFRFEQYLDIEGVTFTQESFWNENEWPRIYEAGSMMYKVVRTLKGFARRLGILFQVAKYDKVFIHREATPIGPPWFEWLVAKVYRKPIIFDFDDAIWMPNSSKSNEKLAGKLKFHGKTSKICSWSSIVVAGNEFLADYARQYCNDVRIIPTTIDTENHHNPGLYRKVGAKWYKKSIISNESDSNNEFPNTSSLNTRYPIPNISLNTPYRLPNTLLTIGWTGTHSTLKQLTPLFPILEKIHESDPFRFLLIADVPPDEMPDFVEFRKWRKETEIEDLLEIDIGVMPLYDTDWERGKCGFKALQYQSLGIPAVVSAVGVNAKIVVQGKTGFLCEALSNGKAEQWKQQLIRLIENKNLRLEMGKFAKVHVDENYSLTSQELSFRSLI